MEENNVNKCLVLPRKYNVSIQQNHIKFVEINEWG